ncbi:MAG TPA: SCP2 sterol-binding domain-containing protein [Polyangiaceae bacterium]|nr:SCP2 sterol-binding domain-containing protein [Polyangiaceae bacterium]
MTDVPSDPEAFFTAFLPGRLRRAARAFEGITSVGSILFRVPDREWSFRLRDGELEWTRSIEDDVMLQITIPEEDFEVVVVEPMRREESAVPPPDHPGAFAALAVRPEIARQVRHVPGSVLFSVKDGERAYRALVTPGRRVANLASPECSIECSLPDVLDARERGLSPLQLFAAGKLRIRGNVQIAMALAGIFTK